MNKLLKNILIFVNALFVVFIIVFIVWFRNHPISNQPSDWNTFASFVSSIIGPLIGVINLVLVYHISKIISKNDDKRFLNEIIFKLYNQLNEEYDKLDFSKFSNRSFLEFESYIINFGQKHRFLFNENEDTIFNLCFELEKSLSFIKLFVKQYGIEEKSITNLSDYNLKYIKYQYNELNENVNMKMISIEMFIFRYKFNLLSNILRDSITNKNIDFKSQSRNDMIVEWNKSCKKLKEIQTYQTNNPL